MFDIIIVGDYCLDLIFTGLPEMPVKGREIVGKGFEMVTGGTCNSAIAMHRLGLKVGWAADFGNDDFSAFVLKRIEKEGLDQSLFLHHPNTLRNITISLSYTDDRAFIAYYDKAPLIPAGFKKLNEVEARALYIPGIYYGIGMDIGNLIIRHKGMKLVMDGNSPQELRLKNRAVKKAIQSVDLFLPNATEARRLTGCLDIEAAAKELGELTPLVVVKDGSGGAYACAEGIVSHVPGIKVKPLDTTGAGDCFNAGFVKAWLDGMPLEDCLKWGNIVGGLSTLGRGGTGRRVTVEDVAKQMKFYE
jgi:sugar/nucleoside kinase (ribokinase family)